MDVKGAFPHVAKGNLIKRMEEMGFEADLARWVESFMADRKVIMSMDGKEGDSMDVETGVPQGLPVSPVLFVIYLSGLFGQVEMKEKESGSEGISFVDDVAWVVEGEDVGECTQQLERCAAETEIWARMNACQLVLATGPNSRVGSGSSSNPEPNRCNGFLHKTRSSKVNISCCN